VRSYLKNLKIHKVLIDAAILSIQNFNCNQYIREHITSALSSCFSLKTEDMQISVVLR